MRMTKNQARLYDVAFVFLLPLAAILTLPWHNGFAMGDDYLGPAHQLLKGNIDLSTCWSNRIGTYLPYALGMKLFGLGTWLTSITTLEYILLLVSVYLVIGKYDKSIAFIAAFLLGVSPLMHQYAGIIMGDMAATFTANLVMLAYFYYTFYVSKKESTSKKWGILIALLVVVSFLVKESVVFYMPVLLGLFWLERKEQDSKIFFRYFLFTSVISAIVFMAFYGYKTGSPLHRLYILETGPSENDSNYAFASWHTILNRITWQPFQLIVENYSFGCLFFLSGLQLLIPSPNNRPQQFFKWFGLGTLAMWWFGTQGVSSYNPLALVHRIWMPLMVPMAINSAFLIHRIMSGSLSASERKKITAATLLFLLLTYISLWFSHLSYLALPVLAEPQFVSMAIWYTIIGVAMLFSIYTDTLVDIIPPVRTMLFCILIVPLVNGTVQLTLARIGQLKNHIKTEYDWEKEMIQYVLSLKPSLIITDPRLKHFYYTYTMNMDKKLPFEDYNHVVPDSLKEGDYMLLNLNRQLSDINNITSTLTFTRADNKLPSFVINPKQHGFVLIKENEADKLYRYEPHNE